jgi:hypothetical protein
MITRLPAMNVFLKTADVIPHFTEGIPLGDAESRMTQIAIFLHRLLLHYNRCCLFEIPTAVGMTTEGALTGKRVMAFYIF